mgnify:FL=1
MLSGTLGAVGLLLAAGLGVGFLRIGSTAGLRRVGGFGLTGLGVGLGLDTGLGFLTGR